MKKETIKLFWCEKLNCKLTPNGCKALQRRAKRIRKFEYGVIDRDTIAYLIDPLCQVPCLHCANPISKLQ